MRFSGFQKITLLDFPGRVACTLFVSGCNFRCPFCHNPDLVFCRAAETISQDDAINYLEKRKGIVDGVCITGGEPTLKEELTGFITKIKSMGFAVKLDTNGYRPEVLEKLLKAQLLDYVAMDIKSSPESYAAAAGLDKCDFSKIEKSIHLLLESGIDYEFRTTAVKELTSPNDFIEIGKLISGAKRYFIQAFEDRGNTISGGLTPYTKDELLSISKNLEKYVSSVQLRGI